MVVVVAVRCSVACNVRALLWGKVSHCELLYHNPAHLNKIYFIFVSRFSFFFFIGYVCV